MALESLQINSVSGGNGTVRDTGSSGSGIASAFESLGLNFASALGAVGIAKIAQSAGLTQTQVAAGSTSLLGKTPAATPAQAGVAAKPNWSAFLLVGGVFTGLVALVLHVERKRRRE